jgi:hypothetical protein
MEREGELAMATGSLTTRWSYPEAEVAEYDLQHARDRKEEYKKGPSTVADSSKKIDLHSIRREQLLKQPKKPSKVERP